MKILVKIWLFPVIVFFAAAVASGNSDAEEFPLAEKLQQCEAVFAQMHSGNLSQEKAWKMRRQHKKQVKEILAHLNKRNHEAMTSQSGEMSARQMTENLVVIGSLLEMLAAENLRVTDEWGYPVEE